MRVVVFRARVQYTMSTPPCDLCSSSSFSLYSFFFLCPVCVIFLCALSVRFYAHTRAPSEISGYNMYIRGVLHTHRGRERLQARVAATSNVRPLSRAARWSALVVFLVVPAVLLSPRAWREDQVLHVLPLNHVQ